MRALISGASSGIGRDMARELALRNIDLVLVARRKDRLEELKKELHVKIDIECLDLSKETNCKNLYDKYRGSIDILINNAGLGDFGNFDETLLEKDLQIVQTNIVALHILTKLFLQDFVKENRGYLLNVASSAAFLPGPLMATYYASKSYVLHLSLGIYKELKKRKSAVSISVLCPGPTKTEFDSVAHVKFLLRGKRSEDIAQYAIHKMFQRKVWIIPGFLMKASYLSTKIFPMKLLLSASYHIQHRKNT